MKLEQKTWQFIEKFHMLSEGTGVVVGLSGGADSVALLEMLCSLRESMKFRLAAVHVHHGIRLEAGEDADFCRRLCMEKQVDFFLEYVNVPELAKDLGLSLEEAGRNARYQLFEAYRRKLNMDVIAVAHHQNDQAETMLFQLFRGSGLRGLAGMSPIRGTIIRPLLAVTREEIEEYLQEKNLCYVTDATNASTEYARNKVRHRIIPVGEEISAGAVEHMSRTAGQLREVLDFMEQQARAFLKEHGTECDGELQVSVEALSGVHPALQKMIITEAVARTFRSRKDITEKHVQSILSLLSKNGEKKICLPGGGQVVKRYKEIVFQYGKADILEDAFEARQIEPGETYFLPDGTILETKLLFENNLENIPKNDCTKWFDYDKIKGVLFLRTREKGDYLMIRDDGATKSLQDYLVNEKVPKAVRDRLPVLADEHHIMWVLGKRISAHYKVTEQTKRILQVHIGGK